MISIISLTLFCYFFINLSHQKVHKDSKDSNFETCKENDFAAFDDPMEMLENLKNAKNSMIKDLMFETLKDTFAKMKDLPKEMADKIKSEDFLKDAIDTVLNQEKQRGNQKSSKSKPTAKEQATSFTYEKRPFRPYKGQVRLEDWHDFYHYFPHLANTVRLWKLEFKESSRRNWKRFKGCANPGRLVDWLVPDLDDVKKSKKKAKFMSKTERQRDF